MSSRIPIDQRIIALVCCGGIGVMPTDTIYGLVGSARSRRAVLRIYRVRKRNRKKPMIILISSRRELRRFGVRLTRREEMFLRRVWPGKVSVILWCRSKTFSYLHRGTHTLAFRLPKLLWLTRFLRRTGPLVAPSANPEGAPPARTAQEAYDYFRKNVDFYVDGGVRRSAPSAIVRLSKKGAVVTRGKPPSTRLGEMSTMV